MKKGNSEFRCPFCKRQVFVKYAKPKALMPVTTSVVCAGCSSHFECVMTLESGGSGKVTMDAQVIPVKVSWLQKIWNYLFL